MKGKILKYSSLIILTLSIGLFARNSSGCSKAQGSDSLKKFSYLLILMNNNDTIGNATGYLVRNKGDLFLVGAYHTFFNLDMINNTFDKQKYNKLILRYPTNKNNYKYYDISLIEIQLNNKPVSEYDTPDVYVKKITLPAEAIINSVETFIPGDNIVFLQGQKIFLFGYHQSEFIKQRNPDYRKGKSIEGKTLAGSNQIIRANVDLKYYFPISAPAEPGQSGAPAFVINEENKVYLYGTFSSTNAADHMTFITKVSELKKILNK